MDKYYAIIFDLDGTLYDINDTISNTYELQVTYASQKLHLSRENTIKLFCENNVFPIIKSNSCSATEFFYKIGLNPLDWTRYRNTHYSVLTIDKLKSVKNETIKRFAKNAKIYLVSSNTTEIVKKTLNHIGISDYYFSKIICSDSNYIGDSFSKFKVFRKIFKEAPKNASILSIGDRYETDIKPMIMLGGDGVLVNSPHSVSIFLEDMVNERIGTDGYTFFNGNKDIKNKNI